MTADSKIRAIKRNFRQRGGAAMKNARRAILADFRDNNETSQALRYFSNVTLKNALPVFPALISISCEGVGGETEKTVPFGEAMVLISAAADLHDDVIDHSLVKGSKQTVLGKFNSSAAILAGDILVVQGFKQLTEAANLIQKEQSKEIIKLVSEAVYEICSAEALECKLHGRLDLTPEDYLEVIRLKAVVPELMMKVGAIIGGGTSKDVENLGQFGRTYGVNSIILEEFADLLDIEEMRNRLRNECPPLPVVYALQNPQNNAVLLSSLSTDLLSKSAHEKIVEIVLGSHEMQALQKILISNAKSQLKKLPKNINTKIREELENLLLVPLNYLEV